MIAIATTKADVRSAIGQARHEGMTVGFVPTMGALHDGHLSLVRAARARFDFVVASIFVNPTQFGPGEDFQRYPRRIEIDTELLSEDGASLVWTPGVREMYRSDAEATVDPGPLAARWEGEVRPGHFSGVATIVTKMLSVIQPDAAFFGEKDFQQLAVVRRVERDLDLHVEIVGCPTVRDTDGLALSSRNAYLSAEDRVAALALPLALQAAENELVLGNHAHALEAAMRSAAREHAGDALALDYAAIVDPDTLEPLERVVATARAIIAGRVGSTRLLDNRELRPSASS